jgi:hypothetical protein
MITLIYAVIAIVFLALVLRLFGRTGAFPRDESTLDSRSSASTGNGRWLHLSERIFDSSDARWLAEELAFPKLAKDLMLERKCLAIHWLEALQASFAEIVRTPEPTSNEVSEVSRDGWKTLWLTVRFKILLSYALLVVKLFGPYHRLIPSFSWVPFYRKGERSLGRAEFAESRSSR